jgi:hypothetical protein
MRLFLVAIISLFYVIPLPANGAEFIKDVIKLSDSLTDGTPVKIEVRKVKISSRYPYPHAFIWGGDELDMPKTVITALDILSGTEKIYVPLSAYSDLGDPNQVSLERTQKGFQIIIQGGEAASSYKAVLVFNHENIKRRKVIHGEFPDEVWEETTYSFISQTEER